MHDEMLNVDLDVLFVSGNNEWFISIRFMGSSPIDYICKHIKHTPIDITYELHFYWTVTRGQTGNAY